MTSAPARTSSATYLPFAEAMANRYRTAREPHEDLQQVASMGLFKAIDRFDPDRGVPFKGFAGPTILGELKRHFRDRVWTVRVPRSVQEGIAEVETATADLEAELQRTPSVREIAEHLGRSETDVLEALEANMQPPARLDRPAGATTRTTTRRRRPSGSAPRMRASSWSRGG